MTAPHFPVIDRFFDRIILPIEGKITDCWWWYTATDTNGYGRIHFNKQDIGSHRYSYMIFKGEISKDLVIDHLCNNKRCVNPDHLELVTQIENLKRRTHKYLNS